MAERLPRRAPGGPGRSPSARAPGRPSPDRSSPDRSSPDRSSPGTADPARRAAYDLLREVSSRAAYANLVLPDLLRQRRVSGRDAALATELGYGTLRAQGTIDAVLGSCSSRPIDRLDPAVLDVLRLGAYQLLRTRIPAHAAVSATVELTRTAGSGRAAGFVNAVLRRVGERDWDWWTDRLFPGPGLDALAARHAHPAWIAAAFAAALGPGAADELPAALAADDARPQTHLVARPGRMTRAELLSEAGADSGPGPYSPFAVRMGHGDPGGLAPVRDGRAAVLDEGSQLCALALAAAPVDGPDDGPDERWLDLCAGPGGKAALLAGLAAARGAVLDANDLHAHRAQLVRQATAYWGVAVTVGDGADVVAPTADGRTGYDRVLLDAPCTGLGALRRRPEARWRRQPGDVAPLAALQTRLLVAALGLTRPGGLVGYVTCSPHPAETVDVVTAAAGIVSAAGRTVELVDARAGLPGVPDLGHGPAVQLWPHRQGTDAMFCALLRCG